MAKNESGGSQGPAQPSQPSVEKEVHIYSLATTANECIIFLEELSGNRLLPIWIGITEGQAIAIRFSGIVLPRPLTHDLLLGAITTLGYSVQKVVVCDIKDNTFYARIRVVKEGQPPVDLDSRPSDAIALALRSDCPIYVTEAVLQSAKLNTSGPPEGPTAEQLRGWLEGLNDEDLGRYKM